MAGRGRTSFQKKMKEQSRLERRQAKQAKRIARKQAKEAGIDPDAQESSEELQEEELQEQAEDGDR